MENPRRQKPPDKGEAKSQKVADDGITALDIPIIVPFFTSCRCLFAFSPHYRLLKKSHLLLADSVSADYRLLCDKPEWERSDHRRR